MGSLQVGNRLGRYEIVAPLGAGGMGEVYRAHDTVLGREVALKVLLGTFSDDPERLARFEREARAASTLNHPHICTIHDVGEHDGTPYLVMELIEGQSLRERIDAGPLSTLQMLNIGAGVADALAAAHAAGIVHRDIKPANIFLTARGEAKVLDFGLARINEAPEDENIDLEAPTLYSPDLTRAGTTMGTVSYMSPEQVLGERVGEKSDVFSFGVALYEMATGNTPFSGRTSGAVFDQIVHAAPTSPVQLNPDLPRGLEPIINRCLQKTPADRCTAIELRGALEQLRREVSGETLGPGTRLRRLASRPAVWLTAFAAIAVMLFGGVEWLSHAKKVRWAREVVLPVLREMEADPYTAENAFAGHRLIREASPYLAHNAEFQELKPLFASMTSVATDPPGAEVWVKPYTDPDAPWESMGVTPIEAASLPVAYLRWRIEKPGHETVLDISHTGKRDPETGRMIPSELFWRLDPVGARPPNMVAVPTTDEVPAFLVDRYEVTNQQFKQFIEDGGYAHRNYWKHEFVLEGRTVGPEAAFARFVDQTGRPGPGTWEAGDYPDGQGDYPVTGVSWYEAAAFAESTGKSLPTIDHWDRATGIFLGPAQWYFTGLFIPMSNFGGVGPMAVGASHAMTPLGAVDMAGNVREWCLNQAPAGRCIRGGAWNDATYMFGNITQADPFDRSEKNGLRCIKFADATAVPDELFEPLDIRATRSLGDETHVTDEVFAAYLALFDYDPFDLDSRVESRHDEADDWVREKVSYSAAYGGELITAQIFLPRNAVPPYQAVLYFPGSGAVSAGSTDFLEQSSEFRLNVAFLVKTGRAVLCPAYRGTYERRHGISSALHWSLDSTHEFTAFQVNLVKDVRRSVDYLQSRPDIDPDRIAYVGFSWGGTIANLVLAVERRFKAAALNVGGMTAHGTPRPEVDYLNYAPRITLPVLMLNGRYDLALLYESEVEPMFNLLGTPPENKRLIMYETDHWIDRREVAKETLAWLDRYLGPVTTAK